MTLYYFIFYTRYFYTNNYEIYTMNSNESLEKFKSDEYTEKSPLLVDRASPVYIVIEENGEIQKNNKLRLKLN